MICALTILLNCLQSPIQTNVYATSNEQIYFTINTKNKTYFVTDEILRGGWWNEESQKNFRGEKSIYEIAQDYSEKEPINYIKKNFPDIWWLVKLIKKETEQKPFDGTVMFHPGEKEHFSVEGARPGIVLDEEKLCKDILSTIKSGEYWDISVSLREIKPKSAEKILAKLGLRGGYTTYFESNPPREYNINLALSKFNGLTLQNGQTVSFNKIVGPRTSERGFEEAKIILDGEFVPGVGGGVCQASTTLFNAALLAGLDIDKSYNHSLAISYVPIGRDAMVLSAADLCITNNSGGKMYFETGTVAAAGKNPGYAFVRIYGNKTNIKYKPRVEMTESELNENEIIPARKSSTYIEAWSGDKLVQSKLVRKSRYNAVTKD